MAITVIRNNPAELRLRNAIIYMGTLSFDSSYPTGGESLDGIDPGLDMVIAEGGSYVWQFDRTNNKLKAMKMSGTSPNIKLTEEANATDLSAETGILFMAIKFAGD